MYWPCSRGESSASGEIATVNGAEGAPARAKAMRTHPGAPPVPRLQGPLPVTPACCWRAASPESAPGRSDWFPLASLLRARQVPYRAFLWRRRLPSDTALASSCCPRCLPSLPAEGDVLLLSGTARKLGREPFGGRRRLCEEQNTASVPWSTSKTSVGGVSCQFHALCQQLRLLGGSLPPTAALTSGTRRSEAETAHLSRR